MNPPVPRIWIVIPCYNEEQRLPREEFQEFAARHSELGFLFVNDGSRDATSEVLRGLVASEKGTMAAIDLPENAGKAEAVRAGVLELCKRGDAEWIGYWDADLATPLEEIPRFVEIARRRPELRFIIGSRVRRLGAAIERDGRRHIMGRVFATFASRILGLPVYDTQCGAKLVRADLGRAIFDRPLLSRWIFDVELLARTVLLLGRKEAMASILELPLETWEEKGGSRLRPIHFLRAPMELWHIGQVYKRPPEEM